MSEFSIAMEFERLPSKTATSGRQPLSQNSGLRRLEPFTARRNSARVAPLTAPTRHLDAEILDHGEALEGAWEREIMALIAWKRLRTPEAEAAAAAARAVCAQVVARIESAAARTLDGLKVKARAALWTRNGEPLGAPFVEFAADDA